MIRISTGLANLIIMPQGLSFSDAMQDGVIRVYSGEQPSSANDAETGTHLCTVTKDGVVFTPGYQYGGLNFVLGAPRVLSKPSTHEWHGIVLADGMAGWFRHYDNRMVTGASETAVRYDGAIDLPSGQGNMQVSHRDCHAGEGFWVNFYAIFQPTA